VRPAVTQLHQIERRFYEKTERRGECLEWVGGRNEHGYGISWFNGCFIKAHRLAWMLVGNDLPQGKFVLHSCDNPPCVEVTHLYLGTRSDNARDMWTRKRRQRPEGELSPTAKLSNESVLSIRKSKERSVVLAAHYGVTPRTIQQIRSRETWRHL